MDLHFTETGQLWKETVFEIDMSIKHLGGTLIQVDNCIYNFGLWVRSLARVIHLPAR